MKAFRLLAAVLLLGGGVALADEVEVIELRYRTAEQLIPTLRPLVAPGGVVTGMQSSLVIRSSRANIEELRRIVASLDRAPRRLLISVRQEADESAAERAASVGGTVAGGRGGASVGPGAPAGSGVNVRITDATRTGDDRIVQQVQALEGSPAFINVGTSVPVPTRSVTRGPGGVTVTESVVHHETGSGFYVLPRLAGDRVTLEINPRRETPGPYGPASASTQAIVTTASGRLGEWIELGGIDQRATREERGVLSRGTASRQSARRVWVKVDELR